MILYYFRIAWRNICKQLPFYFINIGGLSVGLAACLVITHYVFFHSNFDNYQPYSERTYRLNYARTTENGEHIRFASATPIIGSILNERLPQIELLGLAHNTQNLFLYNDHYSHDAGFYWGETAMIDLLGLQLIHGQAAGALERADQVVISESLARKYFGNEDPLGQRLYLNPENSFEVSAVFRDVPDNTHFPVEAFISMEVMRDAFPNAFSNGHFMSGFYNYLRIKEGADPDEVNAMIIKILDEVYAHEFEQHRFHMEIELQPVRDIHLHSNYHHELQPNGSHTAIRMLGIISWFILIIAWANYFNLSSINMLTRTRETAIRKLNGASPTQIRTMYLCESSLVNLMAVFVALLITELSSPVFAQFTGVPPIAPVWQHGWVYLVMGIAFTFGTLSALFYTGTTLKSSNLSQVIKGVNISPKGRGGVRRIMLTLQYALALGLMFSSLTIFRQYHHIKAQEKGFRTQDILALKVPVMSDSLSMLNYHSFRNELETMPSVMQIGFSTLVPGYQPEHNIGGLRLEGRDTEDSRNLKLLYAETNYFDVYGINLLEGELFTGNYSSDSSKVILNETAVRNFGIDTPGQAIRKRIFRGPFTFHIIGVVADMHHVSPKEMMEPLIYMAPSHYNGFISIRLHGEGTYESRQRVGEMFVSFFPHIPLDSFWVDELYAARNEDERKFGMIFGLFSGLALLVTLLGITGVAAFTARQRQKEIAIRKSLGGSLASIFLLLFKSYLGQLMVAALLVFPLSYLWLENWLNQFAMRINTSFLSMAIPMALVIIATLLTVWVQSLQILRINPAVILKE